MITLSIEELEQHFQPDEVLGGKYITINQKTYKLCNYKVEASEETFKILGETACTMNDLFILEPPRTVSTIKHYSDHYKITISIQAKDAV